MHVRHAILILSLFHLKRPCCLQIYGFQSIRVDSEICHDPKRLFSFLVVSDKSNLVPQIDNERLIGQLLAIEIVI